MPVMVITSSTDSLDLFILDLAIRRSIQQILFTRAVAITLSHGPILFMAALAIARLYRPELYMQGLEISSSIGCMTFLVGLVRLLSMSSMERHMAAQVILRFILLGELLCRSDLEMI